MQPPRIEVTTIGVDLDNTLIDYGLAYAKVAEELGVKVDRPDRQHIRRALRRGSDDHRWQEFQSLLYTDGLQYAQLAIGAEEFLSLCTTLGIRVCIVSHKSARGPQRYGSRKLRKPVQLWLANQGVTPEAVKESDVYFEDTQDAKLQRIREIGAELFIDDLESVLAHPLWPSKTLPIEYSPGPWCNAAGRWKAGFPSLTHWLRDSGAA